MGVQGIDRVNDQRLQCLRLDRRAMFVRAVVSQNDMENVRPDFFEAAPCQERLIGLSNLEQSRTYYQRAKAIWPINVPLSDA